MDSDKRRSELVSSLKVSCSGEIYDVSTGHPLVWLQIDEEKGYVFCPYCETKFVYNEKSNSAQ